MRAGTASLGEKPVQRSVDVSVAKVLDRAVVSGRDRAHPQYRILNCSSVVPVSVPNSQLATMPAKRIRSRSKPG